LSPVPVTSAGEKIPSWYVLSAHQLVMMCRHHAIEDEDDDEYEEEVRQASPPITYHQSRFTEARPSQRDPIQIAR
jgi:hypothetical protein